MDTSFFEAILLIDDDVSMNYYHKIMLEEWQVTQEIYETLDGKEGLDFILNNTNNFCNKKKSLILLDINMPIMDGFEFLESYAKLESKLKDNILIVLLTTSLHPKDIERAKQFKDLKGYVNKPLEKGDMEDIVSDLKEMTFKTKK